MASIAPWCLRFLIPRRNAPFALLRFGSYRQPTAYVRLFSSDGSAGSAAPKPPSKPAGKPQSRTKHIRKYTPEDDKLLMQAYHASQLDSPSCAAHLRALFPNHSISSLRRRAAFILRGRRLRSPWTAEEDDMLLKAVDTHGMRWVRVSTLVKGRDPGHCLTRWRSLTANRRTGSIDAKLESVLVERGGIGLAGSQANRGRYTAEEKQRLRDAVALYGVKDWLAVSQCVGTRTPKQCEDAWAFTLQPGIALGPWTPKEDVALAHAVATCGRNWADVAAAMAKDSAAGLEQDGGMEKRRTSRQCRQRAMTIGLYAHDCDDEQTRAAISTGPIASNSGEENKASSAAMVELWTEDEDEHLMRAALGRKFHRRSWEDVATEFPRRSTLACRIRFAWLQRHKASREWMAEMELAALNKDQEWLYNARGNGGGSRAMLPRKGSTWALEDRLFAAVSKDNETRGSLVRRYRYQQGIGHKEGHQPGEGSSVAIAKVSEAD